MMLGLYNGISGIKTQDFGIDVTANNIANINTVGFKSSSTEFKSLMYQDAPSSNFGPVDSQIGMGSSSMETSLNFKQGSLVASDNKFDLAIDGNGFFGVSDLGGNNYYTRNGEFTIDKSGNVVDRNGRFLLGTMANLSPIELSASAKEKYGNAIVNNNLATQNIASTLPTNTSINLVAEDAQTNIKLPNILFLPSTPTTEVSYKANLDSSIIKDTVTINLKPPKYQANLDNKTISLEGDLKDTPAILQIVPNQEIILNIKDKDGKQISTKAIANSDGKFKLENLDVSSLNLNEPLEISSIATLNQEVPSKQHFSTEIFSPNGNKNLLKMEFIKQIPSNSLGTTWNVTATIFSPKNEEISRSDGILSFDDRGALINNSLGSLNNDGANLNINLGSIYDPNLPNSGFDGLHSTANQPLNLSVNKNGEPEGLLKEYSMNDNGEIIALFDNGKMASVAKVALYHFQNNQGLNKVGENAYMASANSGNPIFYTNAQGKAIYGANIKPNMLEMSNADLGTLLTELIVMQKSYDANSKSITTSDQMIQKAINMKK